MKLQIVTALSALVANAAAANEIDVQTYCRFDGSPCTVLARWYPPPPDKASYVIDASDGCRDNPGIPYVYRLCMDWTRRRAHYYVENQGKRCMKEFREAYSVCGKNLHCHYHGWGDTPCTWRTADGDAEKNGTVRTVEQGGKNVTFTA